MANAEQCHLLVFAKAPLAGEVKTRLSPFLTPQQSMQLHRRLVEHCLKIAHCGDLTVELWCGKEHPWWQFLRPFYDGKYFLQQGDDLGQRMRFSLLDTLNNRCDKALLIGTDCPAIDEAYLQQAAGALDTVDVVLGPAEDGGYVLVGIRADVPELFIDIPWGTDQVMAITRQRIAALGLSCVELPLMSDVDRPEDLLSLEQSFPQLTAGLLPESS
ncbi:MAG: rSAM/selenodomain-associated transferase 1 [Oceanicoccus sp.]|jgi:rSAM/selenodomain-associated transferase 1